VSWHFHIFDKLAKTWRHLDFPDDGWKETWPGSRRDQCTLAAIEDKRARPSSRASESTLRHWARRIPKHILDNPQARAWLQEVSDRHKDGSTADRQILRISPSGDALTVADVCVVLQTGELGRPLKHPPNSDGKTISLGEWIWHQLLRDTYPVREFDFVFHFGHGGHEAHEIDPGISPAAMSQSSTSDTLRAVQKLWRPDLRPESHVKTQWPGRYILYRVDQDAFERSLKGSQKRWSDEAYGWFGAQRVLRVPLSLGSNDHLVEWHDVFPDPIDGLYESRGLLAQNQDGTVDVFGYDAFTLNESGKFLVSLMRTRGNNARGVVFAREKADNKIITCYRIWLHKVDKDEAYDELTEEVTRVDSVLRGRSSAEQKQREYRQNTTLFQPVAQLLDQGRYPMINYLFGQPVAKESDLGKRSKVKAIKPFPLSQVIFTANLQPRVNGPW
jgi:hypothetical protein